VTDGGAVAERCEWERPDVVINCAAWTDVDGAEGAEEQAMAVNGIGAGTVAACAAAVGAKVVYVSTDYVFNGEKGSPYVEVDQPAPISAYGRTKLSGEEATVAANRRSYIVRSGWLFGIGGGNFVETMLRLAADHGEVLVVRDQVGSPTYTWHLAYGIVRLIEGSAFGIHHMAAEGSCSWYEFAREIFDQARVECKVLSATSDMLGRPAARPAFSALATQREHAIRLPPWSEGLTGYLGQRTSERQARA
jgi:dTDP-4-dehydrorhamnose reductase